jgi:hypothetical protein
MLGSGPNLNNLLSLLPGLLLPLTGLLFGTLPLVVEDCQHLFHSPAKLINCTICDSVTPLFKDLSILLGPVAFGWLPC